MRIVIINQYYPPDNAPTGRMLEAVASVLVRSGHEVTVLCSASDYATEINCEAGWKNSQEAPTVVRFSTGNFGRNHTIGKILGYACFYAHVGAWLLMPGRRYDRVIALTTPPYLSLLARFASYFKRADHAHWVMDVYPDVMVAHGMLRDGGLMHRVLRYIARWGMGGRRVSRVVTLGPDMADRISGLLQHGTADTGYGDSREMVRWVPLWGNQSVSTGNPDDFDKISQLRQKRGWGKNEMVVMYSGNMGLGHQFDEVFQVMRCYRKQDGKRVRFSFHGDGRRRAELEFFKSENPDVPLEIHDYAPGEILGEHLCSGDVHLVSLDPLWTGTMLPSKFQGIFAVSRPVIFIGEKKSAMAAWIEESGGGWVVSPGDMNGLKLAIEEAMVSKMRLQRGAAAGIYAAEHFDRDRNAARVAEWLSCPRT
jgi:colanic acid biosynthesis glycosyl transferase WcaI